MIRDQGGNWPCLAAPFPSTGGCACRLGRDANSVNEASTWIIAAISHLPPYVSNTRAKSSRGAQCHDHKRSTKNSPRERCVLCLHRATLSDCLWCLSLRGHHLTVIHIVLRVDIRSTQANISHFLGTLFYGSVASPQSTPGKSANRTSPRAAFSRDFDDYRVYQALSPFGCPKIVSPFTNVSLIEQP
jgi:hypothetical protein